jgi:alpha-tubulin suppressor-like RCC1 family protein
MLPLVRDASLLLAFVAFACDSEPHCPAPYVLNSESTRCVCPSPLVTVCPPDEPCECVEDVGTGDAGADAGPEDAAADGAPRDAGPDEACEERPFFEDSDGDEYGSTLSSVTACVAPGGFVARGGDCDDANDAVHPGAEEQCNGADDDCDGMMDDGAVAACGSAIDRGARTCTAGACGIACDPGWGDCDETDTSGCELDLAADVDHCGACDRSCGWTCVDGSCDDPVSLDVGFAHACVVLASGGVACWGSNGAGERGDGELAERLAPTRALVTGVSQVSAGFGSGFSGHSCARSATGEVTCWGPNYAGQLGDGTTTDRLAPVTVLDEAGAAPLSGVRAVSASGNRTCALMTWASVLCWGGGQLGNGTTTGSLLPVAVSGPSGEPTLTSVRQVDSGGFTCVVRDSTPPVYCWGDVPSVSGTATALVPVGVYGLPAVDRVSVGRAHACARSTAGLAYCWGDNDWGQLGDGATVDRSSPAEVVGVTGSGVLAGVAAIVAGSRHTCALLDGGSAACWGRNLTGQLGDGTTTDRFVPTPVLDGTGASPLAAVDSLGAGSVQTCALLSGGRPVCWGSASTIGDGTSVARPLPTAVLPPPPP